MGHLEERAGLSGRRAVVLGGAGGLGRACSEDLIAAGCRVAVADRDQAALESSAAELNRLLDVRDGEQLAAFFDAVDAHLGGLDVLVNVVGGTFAQPFEDSVPKGWDTVIRTNFTWLLAAIQLAVPRMRASGGGSIISLGSIEGHRAAPGHAVYSAMKAAVVNLTRTLAVELGPDNIRVNTIDADIVPTEALARLMPPELKDPALIEATDRIGIPLGRRGNYGDIGGCALFLASDLSRFVTGTTLQVDGGTGAAQGWFNWPDSGWSNMPPRLVVEPLIAER